MDVSSDKSAHLVRCERIDLCDHSNAQLPFDWVYLRDANRRRVVVSLIRHVSSKVIGYVTLRFVSIRELGRRAFAVDTPPGKLVRFH
jgi:hypothetical protein